MISDRSKIITRSIPLSWSGSGKPPHTFPHQLRRARFHTGAHTASSNLFKSEWKEKGSRANAESPARASGRRIPEPFSLLIPSDAGLHDFDLTRFLHANRYPSSGQAPGHASLENAILGHRASSGW